MPDTNFNKIKAAAIARDEATLNSLPRARGFISGYPVVLLDVLKRTDPQLSPAGELAMEGNHAAVEFLREQGANVNLIAYGYARGGHVERAAAYYEQHHASPVLIARGFAKRQDAEQEQKYRLLAQNQQSSAPSMVRFTTTSTAQITRRQNIDTKTPSGKVLDEFIKELVKNPIQIIKDHDYPDDLRCLITQSAPIIPVRLYGVLYDLDALLQWHKDTQTDPHTRKPFTLNDIRPAGDIVSELNKIVEENKKSAASQDKGGPSSRKMNK